MHESFYETVHICQCITFYKRYLKCRKLGDDLLLTNTVTLFDIEIKNCGYTRNYCIQEKYLLRPPPIRSNYLESIRINRNFIQNI